jgi:hypothetical protein
MMSDPTIIDYVARDDSQNKLVLIIHEDRPWEDADTMQQQLKNKIDTYFSFIMDPAFSREYPGTQPSDVVITLLCSEPPGTENLKFFHYVMEVLAQDHIGFNFILHPPAAPGPSGMIH